MDDRDPASRVKLDLSRTAAWGRLAVPHIFERESLVLEATAIVFEGAERTYGELREGSRRLANALVGLGIEEFERVAVLSRNRLELMEIEAGIAAARAISVPLNWRLREGELGHLLRRSQSRAILVEEEFVGTVLELRRSGAVPDLRTVIAIDSGPADLSYGELVASASAARPAREGRLEDPHEIIFTSGTTGRPKGAVWANGTVLWNSMQQIVDFRLGPESSTYAIIDMCHIGGRHDFTWPILHQGGTVHIKRSSGFDAREVLRYVAEHRISHVLWVPTMLYELLQLPELDDFDTSALRMIMCGGQPVSASTTQRAQQAFPHSDFIQVYGLTEGGGSVTFVRPEDARRKPGSAGRPSMHVELRLVGPDGADVPPGSEGEILIRAPTVTPGYWDEPEMTERLIVDGWLHTGDMGRLDQDGYLYVSGRKSDIIISGGMNIFPSEIEAVLRRHPGVADVAVIGLPDEKWGESVCAVIEPAGRDGTLDPEDVIAFCSQHLAGYKKPTSVRFVDEMPRTAVGKPRKLLLREQLADAAPTSSF